MTEHVLAYNIELFEDDDDKAATQRLVEFYLHNGYALSEGQDQPLSFHRGKAGAGWWSSDMARLQTEIVAQQTGPSLTLNYSVEVKGQRLTDVDRAFWKREARAAEQFILQEIEEPLDLRPKEAARAKKVQEKLRSRGKWAGIAAFLIVAALGVITERMGCNPFI